MVSFSIVGTGIYRPCELRPSAKLDERLEKNSGWTESKFGIARRGVANEKETSSMMGAEAARKALSAAHWEVDEMDVIIGACGVMEQPIPSTAVLIQQQLGLGKSGIPVFDVNLTCLSFLSALDVAAMGIASGRWKKVLIVSSDIPSAGMDYNVPETASIFGDGAAAICIEAKESKEEGGLLARGFETYGDGHELATLKTGGTRVRVERGSDDFIAGAKFRMDTFGIFKAAAKCLPRLIDTVLEQGGKTRDTVEHIICHQASAPAIEHVRRLFASAPDRVINIFPDYGNMVATSIPTVLCHAISNGIAKKGDHILLLGTAAGVSAGTMLLKV